MESCSATARKSAVCFEMKEMNIRVTKIIFGLFIAQVLCLSFPQIVFCQTETLDIIQYAPPKGWTKTPKEAVMVFSDINKSTNGFCILTVYSSTASAGSPQQDFANEWNELVIKPFKAGGTPQTETHTEGGWTSVAGAAQIETEAGKSYVIMTVLSGYGKTASVCALFNDQSYLPQLDAFMASIKLNKTKDSSNQISTSQQEDPFPGPPRLRPTETLVRQSENYDHDR